MSHTILSYKSVSSLFFQVGPSNVFNKDRIYVSKETKLAQCVGV